MNEPGTITLETERLFLKEMTPDLYQYIFTNYNDEDIKLVFDFDDRGLNKAKERFKQGITNYHATFKYFLMQEKKNGKTIGTGGFYRWYPEHNRGEIGYNMSNESFRNKGLTSEAIIRIFRHGFESMNLHRVEAFASPRNTASIKILEKLGLKYEGLMRGHYLTGDIYEDSAVYGLLKPEFEALNMR